MKLMKLEDARKSYDYFSGKVSEISRKLNYAGIAIIWIFRIGKDSGGIPFDKSLLWPLVLFVLSLAFDLMHYIYSSIAWGILHRSMECKKQKEFNAPRWINWPSLCFFWCKTLFCSVGHISLIVYIFAKL